MQVSVEATTSLERRVTVTVPAAQIDSAVDKKVQETSKSIRLDGFRKGKVPTKVIKKRYGASIREEVLGDVIQSSYFEALQEVHYRICFIYNRGSRRCLKGCQMICQRRTVRYG
jgi:trigger factor